MSRSVWLIVLVLSLGACADAADTPAVERTSPATPAVKDEAFNSCDALDEAPTAVLSYIDEHQADARVAVNWTSDDCAINSHPFDTLPLPDFAVQVPLGESSKLTFSAKPDTVSGYAWLPDFSLAEEPSGRKVEVPLDGLRSTTRIDLALDPVASQQLDLTSLAPGDYAIEVFAVWHNGSSGFAFHVEIIGP